MPIRPATSADLEPINRILTRAFWDEDVCGRVVHPLRESFPNEPVKWWRPKTRMSYWAWDQVLLVATNEEGDITGVASWTLKGSVASKVKPAMWDPRTFTRSLVTAYNSGESWLWPNRAADPAQVDIFDRAMPYAEHHWQGKRADGYYLDLLAIDPDVQKKGYGRELVAWGMERAKAEGVCASVISSLVAEPFYMRSGFEVKVGMASEGEGNPLAEVKAKGGAILFRDAASEESR